MIAAVHAGGSGPIWLGVLIAAEEWGTPPWEIAEDDDRLTWYGRWLEYRKAIGKRNEIEARKRRG